MILIYIFIQKQEATNKIKSTFISLINRSLHQDGLTPISTKHIYKSTILPKALSWNEPAHPCSLNRTYSVQSRKRKSKGETSPKELDTWPWPDMCTERLINGKSKIYFSRPGSDLFKVRGDTCIMYLLETDIKL